MFFFIFFFLISVKSYSFKFCPKMLEKRFYPWLSELIEDFAPENIETIQPFHAG